MFESSNTKPNELTNQYIRLLHETQGNHTGFFQLVEYHQKRQKYYSAHISDGHYKCKVIFRDKASRQIDKGDIKLFSILHGTIANQGNRLFMVTQELKYWDYPRTIGVIRSWKFQTVNNYLNGSNVINWFDNEDSLKAQSRRKKQRLSFDTGFESQNEEAVSVASYCASQINLRKKGSSVSLENSGNQGGAIHQVFSFGGDGNQIAVSETQTCGNQSLCQGSTQSITMGSNLLKMPSKSKSQIIKSVETPANEKSKKLLIVPQSQSETNNQSYKKQQSSAQKASSRKNLQTIERVSEVPSIHEQSDQPSSSNYKQMPTVQKQQGQCNADDEDYDELSDMNAQIMKLKMKKIEKMLDQAEEDCLQEIQRHSRNRKLLTKTKDPLVDNSGSKSKGQSAFTYLMSSEKKDIQSQSHSMRKSNLWKNQKPLQILPTPKKYTSKMIQLDESQFQQILQESQQKETSCYSQGNELTINELSINSQYTSLGRKWINLRIHCFKFIIESNISKLVVVAEQYGKECGHIFNLVLTGGDVYCPFEEGEVYQVSMSGFSVREPQVQQALSQVELRNNSHDVKARKLRTAKKEMNSMKPHFCYMPIQKIQTLKQGISINIVGIVYRYKNIMSKKGLSWTNVFTLIDPFTGTCVDFTIFDAHKLIHEPGSPVVVFNATTKYYQGKITLNVRNYTFYYFGKEIVYDKFCGCINQLDKIRQWQEEGKTVADIEDRSRKYRQIGDLYQAQVKSQQTDEQALNIETPVCRVTKISPFFYRLICDKCTKNLPGNTSLCLACGRREHPLKQLQLSLQISDNSHSLYVQFNHYDSMSWVGEEGEKMNQFRDYIMHKRVKMLLILNRKYKAAVVKMEIVDEKALMRDQIQEIRRLIQYI